MGHDCEQPVLAVPVRRRRVETGQFQKFCSPSVCAETVKDNAGKKAEFVSLNYLLEEPSKSLCLLWHKIKQALGSILFPLLSAFLTFPAFCLGIHQLQILLNLSSTSP